MENLVRLTIKDLDEIDRLEKVCFPEDFIN